MDEYNFKNSLVFAAIGIILLVSSLGLLLTVFSSCGHITHSEIEESEEVIEDIVEDIILEELHIPPEIA